MAKRSLVRSIVWGVCLSVIFSAGVIIGKQKYGTPKSVIHVVTVKWTADSTPEQRQKALDGVKDMAANIPGIRNVWLKTLRVQGPSREVTYDAAFAIEFEHEAAVKAYAEHPKHKEWESIYFPVRQESRSHQVTN